MSKKITYAKIENFKGIKSLETDNLSRFVGIYGANGAGKSSFIEAIQNAIKLQHNGNSKVRYGEDNGLIEVHFGDDFKIKRIVGSKGKLEVEVDGAAIKRPQEWLDGIFQGAIGDPHRFIDLPRQEKVRYILSTYGKEEEYDELERDRARLYDQRTEVARSARAKEQEVEDVDTSLFEELDKMVDIDVIQQELEEANQHNSGYYELSSRKEKGEHFLENAKKEEAKALQDIEDAELEIRRLMDLLEIAKKKKKQAEYENKKASSNTAKAEDRLEEIQAEIDAFDRIDTSDIKKRLTDAREKNNTYIEIKTKQKMYAEDIMKAQKLRQEWRDLNDTINDIQEQQNALLATLSTTYKIQVEDGVLVVDVDGQRIPIDDLNTATQIDLAIDIMLAGPNEIKIITIENANALDPNTMKMVKDKIEKAEGQCFLETVYKTGYESITIEDGEIS